MLVRTVRVIPLTIALVVSLTLAGCSRSPSDTTTANSPANVILIIGDGMDQQQLTIARNYLAGSQDKLLVDTLPSLSSVRVQTLEANNPQQFDYVADSANTATTLATGVLTSQGRISRDAGGLVSLPTIVEHAQAAGYRTGIVTTSSVTDATPAAFASHSRHRKCGGPRNLAKPLRRFLSVIDCGDEAIDRGGPGSIAHQMVNSGLEVLMGGGKQKLSQPGYGGEDSPLASAERNGYQLITTPAELDAVGTDKPLLGLFAAGHLPVQMIGAGQRRAEHVDLEGDKPSLAGEVFSCVQNPAASSVPTLGAMTDKALAMLGDDPQRGFFLMIESASIDKQSHARQPCGHIGEVQQLEQALRSSLDYAANHPNTLILVTADHAHAAQIIPDQEQFERGGMVFHSPGSVARVRTPEGSVMMVNYATTTLPYEMHTGTNVPLYAGGPGVEKLPVYLTQADIYTLMASFLGLAELNQAPGSGR